jgi:DNA polymerase III psi subunit
MSNLNISTEPVINNPALKKLFRDVYITSDNEKQSPDAVAKINHIGNNKSKIFIGVCDNENGILNEDERLLLQKILAAVKLNEDDVFIASLNDIQPVPFNSLISQNKFDKLLFFGIEPKQLNWHIEVLLYQKMNFMEKDILFAESLTVLKANEISKKKLWGQLQSIFSIKK